MASLSDIYLKIETLETLVSTLKKKGEKGISLTISLNDEVNEYGQNVSAWVSQSKEQREQKAKKYYIGNGKVFWTKGETSIAKKPEQEPAIQEQATSNEDDDDLPF